VLLLVPTGTYRAGDFLAAAAELGVEVVVGVDDQRAAAVLGGQTVHVPLHDPDTAAAAVVAIDARTPLDAVVAVDDQGTLTAARAAERLGLRHNPPDAVIAARDKLVMRQRLQAAEVPQPRFVAVPAGTSAHELVAVASAIGFPVVVKPTTLSASQGVIRADGPSELVATAARVRAIATGAGVPSTAPLLVEQYVPGTEVALEGMLDGGALRVLAIFDKPDPLEGPYFEETLYVTPSRMAATERAAVVRATQAAARALGLRDGPVHAELRVRGERAVVLEVAARTIGGLCSRTLRFGTGRSLESLVLAHALGRPDAVPPTGGAAGVLMIPIPAAGTLVGIDGEPEVRAIPGIVGMHITVPRGGRLVPVPEGDRYLGFVFARAATPAAVEHALREARRVLAVRVDPDG